MTSTDGVALQEAFDALLKRQQERLTLPWLGTTLSIGVCSIVLAAIAQDEPREVAAALRYAMMVLGAALAAAAAVVPARILTDAKIAAAMRDQPDVLVLSKRLDMSHDENVMLASLDKPEVRLLGLTLLFPAPYFIALALSEAVALVGFAAGLMTDSVVAAAPYFLVSFVLHGVHYPRLAPLVARGRKLDQPDEELQELSRTLDQMKGERLAAARAARHTPAASSVEAKRASRATPEPSTGKHPRPSPRTKS